MPRWQPNTLDGERPKTMPARNLVCRIFQQIRIYRMLPPRTEPHWAGTNAQPASSISKPWEFHMMTFVPNPFNPSRSLPTFAAIQRRRQELLAYQARQEQAQATAAPGELLAEDQAHPSEESSLFREQEEHQELQHSYPDDSYPGEDSEPSFPPPPRSSATLTPALADPALYGIAGRLIQGPDQGSLQSPCKQRAHRPRSRTTDDPRSHQ
jgi:hypothetical protein